MKQIDPTNAIIAFGSTSIVMFIVAAIFVEYGEWTEAMLSTGVSIVFWKLCWYLIDSERSRP